MSSIIYDNVKIIVNFAPNEKVMKSGDALSELVGKTAFHVSDRGIHVTAAEKATWSAKAELSDIPAALPANGGNADTVNGKTVQISSYRGFSSLDASSADEANTIWKAIPPDSVFAIEAQYLTHASWSFPAGTGQYTLLIAKLSNQRLLGMFLFPKSNGSIYFANVDQNGDFAGNWRRLCSESDIATATAAGIVSTGTQTFGGTKTVTGNLYMQNLDYEAGATAPSTAQTRAFRVYDKKMKIIADYPVVVNTDNTTSAGIRAFRTNGDATSYSQIATTISADGATKRHICTSPTSAAMSSLRQLASGTASANTTNCPNGAWYGQYEEV